MVNTDLRAPVVLYFFYHDDRLMQEAGWSPFYLVKTHMFHITIISDLIDTARWSRRHVMGPMSFYNRRRLLGGHGDLIFGKDEYLLSTL